MIWLLYVLDFYLVSLDIQMLVYESTFSFIKLYLLLMSGGVSHNQFLNWTFIPGIDFRKQNVVKFCLVVFMIDDRFSKVKGILAFPLYFEKEKFHPMRPPPTSTALCMHKMAWAISHVSSFRNSYSFKICGRVKRINLGFLDFPKQAFCNNEIDILFIFEFSSAKL